MLVKRWAIVLLSVGEDVGILFLRSRITCVIPELLDHVCVLLSSDPGDIFFFCSPGRVRPGDRPQISCICRSLPSHKQSASRPDRQR